MKKPAKIRLLLVDDHFIVRIGLMGAIQAEADMIVAAECGSGEQAIELFRQHVPDVTVMDWRLPGISGMQTTEAIREEFPQARVLLLSVYEGEEDVFARCKLESPPTCQNRPSEQNSWPPFGLSIWARPTFRRPSPPNSRPARRGRN